MKRTTTKRTAQGGPTFADLLTAGGFTPARVEVEARVSMATVYRARRGTVPSPLHVQALARLLGKTEAEVTEAIQQSARRTKGAA